MTSSDLNVDTDTEVTLRNNNEGIKKVITSESDEASDKEVIITKLSDTSDDNMKNLFPEKEKSCTDCKK